MTPGGFRCGRQQEQLRAELGRSPPRPRGSSCISRQSSKSALSCRPLAVDLQPSRTVGAHAPTKPLLHVQTSFLVHSFTCASAGRMVVSKMECVASSSTQKALSKQLVCIQGHTWENCNKSRKTNKRGARTGRLPAAILRCDLGRTPNMAPMHPIRRTLEARTA